MRKLTTLAICLSALILAGCSKPELIITAALFCDLTEQRRFSQESLDWRAQFDAANLRRDYKSNAHFDRECKT